MAAAPCWTRMIRTCADRACPGRRCYITTSTIPCNVGSHWRPCCRKQQLLSGWSLRDIDLHLQWWLLLRWIEMVMHHGFRISIYIEACFCVLLDLVILCGLSYKFQNAELGIGKAWLRLRLRLGIILLGLLWDLVEARWETAVTIDC